MSIGARVKEKRKALKLSQISLSEKSGVPQTTISDYERSATNPSVGNLAKIAHVLGVTVDDLVKQDIV